MGRRWLRGTVAAALFSAGALAACGRSDVVPYVWDSGAPSEGGAPCDATTCPTGCCDPSGACRVGTELDACGFGGVACGDCEQQGFDFCDSQAHACGNLQPTCDVTSCAAGCCTLYNGQHACVSGISSLACGSGGLACADCVAGGQQCDPQTRACVSAPCGPSNCKGCCAGDACVTSPSDAQCGTGGAACVDCATSGETCGGATCVATCDAKSCPGCCQAGTCFAGFVDSRCGSGGAACADCTQQNTTCDTLATPRVCSSQQTTCPAAYGSCGASVSTPVLAATPGQCSATDLQDAQAACSLGFGSAACQSFFQTEKQIHAACAQCLGPFEHPLTDGAGIFACVGPFVAPTCNHTTGCATDCLTQSCAGCSANLEQQCQTQVEQGQCLTYFQGVTCVGSALFGQASFCNPQGYGGNYGAWLAGVGAHYCE